MNSRAVLAILVLGCSSPAHTSSKPSGSGGASSHHIGDAGDTTACPVWPQEKLFPFVGPFFFGPDQGPCTNTETDRSSTGPDKSFTLTYTYNDSGQPVKAATPTGMASGVHSIDYTYSGGQLQKNDDFAAGPLLHTTYHYGTGTAGYSTLDAQGATSNFDYTLDAQGYPQTATYGKMADGKPVDLTGIPTQYEFEYADCKILKRVAFLSDGTALPSSDAQFTYDGEGHLIDVNSTANDFTFDYSCWAPADASTTDGG